MKTLEQIRQEWEKGLETRLVLDQSDSKGNVLVVLEKNNKYHLHRYFLIAGNWEISVDHQRVEVDKVWMWLDRHIN